MCGFLGLGFAVRCVKENKSIINYYKRQRIDELKKENSIHYRSIFSRNSVNEWTGKECDNSYFINKINKIDAEIAQLEREIAEDRYNQSKGESKMDNKEELKRSLAEEKQRVKDSLANVEKMKKQLEELNKKEVEVSATGVYLGAANRENHFTIIGDNSVVFDSFLSTNDKKRFELNYCFESEKQAEQEALRRKIQELIRRRAMEWNSNHDWRKDIGKEQCFLIFRKFKTLELIIGFNEELTYGQIYFDTKELAQQMIDELNKNFNTDELKVGFGVI